MDRGFLDSLGNSLNKDTLKRIGGGYLGIPLIVLITIGMVTLPIPAFMLDMLFTFNIALSLLVLLVSIYTLRPLDFAVFPTILLVTTLLRLALNVASTRVVLLQGHEGSGAAGKVIQAFGEVVIGNNYVVGLVVFFILIIINFVVVTKGAGRISEVSARFTLDALPGKQMAIDADLNAGLIDQKEAHDRREVVRREADFYGAMDGAGKFVRGDAVAGLLILAINIIGGLCIGIMLHNLSFSEAFSIYALLTIGDGLVAQIPSLLLSTAAAIIVTRVSESADVGNQISDQMFSSPRALAVTATIIIVMGLVPGMPHLAFLSLGSVVAAMAWWAYKKNQLQESQENSEDQEQEQTPEAGQLTWDDVPPVDPLGLELGYRLITLVDDNQGGKLLTQIKGIRKSLSNKLGFLIPSVHIRDDLGLKPSAYRISLMGVESAEGELEPDKFLAINPGEVFGELTGMPTHDPAYGLEAIWIAEDLQDDAISLGYTVVDPSTVIATHISKVIEENASELLGHDEVQQLLENLTKHSSKLSEELVPKKLSTSQVMRVLRELLLEDVPVSDFKTIASTLLEATERHSHPQMLAGEVRAALKRTIVHNLVGSEQNIPVVTLDEKLEQVMMQAWQQAQQNSQFTPDTLPLEPGISEQLQTHLPEVTRQLMAEGKPAILLVSAQLRPMMARYARLCTEGMKVLSFNEVPENKDITIVGKVG
ncbi:flagellar biosynthesis protein FlhA [Endozoicomonas arenosclerae]|uniref:flagellar biosynthesis protein FlhA n=1 Tax=Endozoicomonas arenosclerae TaxID=1633495 RepID=UPI000781A1F7|nr:flagellar biosynthesis protein FlhA [Endozoicomonas arenosclerae]